MPHVDAVLMLESMHSGNVLWLLLPGLSQPRPPRSDRSFKIDRDRCWSAALQSAVVALRAFRLMQVLACSLSLRKRR